MHMRKILSLGLALVAGIVMLAPAAAAHGVTVLAGRASTAYPRCPIRPFE